MNHRYLAATVTALLVIILFFLLRPVIDLPGWLIWLGPFSISAAVAFAVMPTLLWISRKIGLIDLPNERKMHEGAIPLVGGITIYLGFLSAYFLYGYILHNPAITAVTIALLPLVVIGVADDLWDIPATVKLLVQLFAAAIVILSGIKLTFLPAGWWGNLLEIVITVIWLIGLTNAINFLDGIDGLATSITVIAAAAFGMVALQTGQQLFLLPCAALCGACIGFLPYNFRRKPAAAFLGDAGATLLGFSLASIAIIGEWGGPGGITLDIVVPLLILGVPIFDTTFITLTRIADGRIRTFKEWLEYTGRDHIHHRLQNLGLDRYDTVGFICIISMVLAISAITLKDATGHLAILSLLQGVIILTIVGRFMIFVENRSSVVKRSADGSPE